MLRNRHCRILIGQPYRQCPILKEIWVTDSGYGFYVSYMAESLRSKNAFFLGIGGVYGEKLISVRIWFLACNKMHLANAWEQTWSGGIWMSLITPVAMSWFKNKYQHLSLRYRIYMQVIVFCVTALSPTVVLWQVCLLRKCHFNRKVHTKLMEMPKQMKDWCLRVPRLMFVVCE